MYGDEIRPCWTSCSRCPPQVDQVLDTMEPVRALARELADKSSVLFLGRHVGYPVALEGALKLKELAYMHAEGFAAGELKHGPIALIEDGPAGRGHRAVAARAARVLHDKIVSNIQEIRARGARTIVIAEEGDEAVVPYADTLIECPPCRRCCSRWSRPCRCRSSPASWPRPRATTWTSRATWRSRSPWSNPAHPRPPASPPPPRWSAVTLSTPERA